MVGLVPCRRHSDQAHLRRQRKHADILTDLCAITTCAPVWTPTGLKVIPYAQDAITSTRTGVTYTAQHRPLVHRPRGMRRRPYH